LSPSEKRRMFKFILNCKLDIGNLKVEILQGLNLRSDVQKDIPYLPLLIEDGNAIP
jgi:hypothetical protein